MGQVAGPDPPRRELPSSPGRGALYPKAGWQSERRSPSFFGPRSATGERRDLDRGSDRRYAPRRPAHDMSPGVSARNRVVSGTVWVGFGAAVALSDGRPRHRLGTTGSGGRRRRRKRASVARDPVLGRRYLTPPVVPSWSHAPFARVRSCSLAPPPRRGFPSETFAYVRSTRTGANRGATMAFRRPTVRSRSAPLDEGPADAGLFSFRRSHTRPRRRTLRPRREHSETSRHQWPRL